MARRPVAGITAIVLVGEAMGLVMLHIFLSMVVDEQRMSLAGLDPGAMSAGTLVGGALLGGYLLLCAGILVYLALRDRAPRRLPRVVLISAALFHGLLGALAVGLVGWTAFGVMMLILGLLVWTLVSYSRREDGGPRHARNTEGSKAPLPPVPAL